MMRWTAALLIAIVSLTAGAADANEIDFGHYRALVIGINDYKHLPHLETAVNDASAVHDLLRRVYGYDSTLLLNPNRTQLVEALDRLRAELTPEDNLLIYYAGHGYLDRPTGEGFWLSVDAKPDSQVEWLPVSDITRLLKASLAKHALVVVDSCYSGVLVRDAPIALKVGPDREAELERLTQKRARKALTSGGLEPVADGGGDGHSVFTRAFLEALDNNKEVLDGYQLYHEVRQRVVVNAAQTPQYSDIRFANDEGGDYLFVPTARLATRQSPAAGQSDAPSDGAIELAFWQSIQDSKYDGDYKAYLARYPNGNFAPLARNRLAELGEGEAAAPAASPAAPPPARENRPPPAAKPPAPELTPVEAAFVALRNANVRETPSTDSAIRTTLAAGSEVYVPARTPDGQWLQVTEDGQALGFVFAPLLQDKPAWERAQAAARQQARLAPQPAAQPEAPQAGPAPAPPRSEAPTAPQAEPPAAKTAAVVVPPAPRGPDGEWRISIRADSFEEGKHGEINEAITVRDGRFSGELKDYYLIVDADLRIHGGRLAGTLQVNLRAPWRPFVVEIDEPLDTEAGFAKTYSALARDFRANHILTLDLKVGLRRN
jgi:uncharacterized caspase-like protein